MIPAALAAQLQQGLADFLRVSFWSSTPGMESVIEDLIGEDGALCKGPYLSVKLPFVPGTDPDLFPDVPLPFVPHAHQERAFERLGGRRKLSTLVATGTGSGKTECFLLPILTHCLADADVPGVKAILVYPMNALATDQAGRLARTIWQNPRLKGRVTAGLYIGGGAKKKGKVSGYAEMGPDHLVTDRKTMQQSPPHILLTNYKMLDYLLLRARDRGVWQHNLRGVLRYMVVDELHTFDGAQGTDLACLIRRLKRRLQADDGSLCCVGTSATLGGPSAGGKLREYAQEVFGEPFDADSVVGESRVSAAEFLAGAPVSRTDEPEPADLAALDPAGAGDAEAWLEDQVRLWLGEQIEADSESYSEAARRVELGRRLRQHAAVHSLLRLLDGRVVSAGEAVAALGRSRSAYLENERFGRLAVFSLLSLISAARSWRPELPEVRRQREQEGSARPVQPFLDVRLQLWQREMRRMVATVEARPRLRFSDDLDRQQRARHLPLVHCRDCGAMGWATLISDDARHLLRVNLQRFYMAFFRGDPRVCFFWPRAAIPESDPVWERQLPAWRVDSRRLVRLGEGDRAEGQVVELVPSHNTRSLESRRVLHRDCPFCGARESLMLLGFRAATLTSTFIDQLFASRFNDDRKLLTFSDSVQDAAHRAGFFGARTWRTNLRIALQQVVRDHEALPLDELPRKLAETWQARMDVSEWVATFLAPNMDWLHDWDALRADGKLPGDSDLLSLIERRLAWEVFHEYGMQARIGRALPRAGASAAYVDPALLAAATDAVLEPLRNEAPGLRQVSRDTVRAFVLGLSHHLRSQGAVVHAEMPKRYLESGGKDIFVFKQRAHLPSFGPRARLPAFLADRAGTRRFDTWAGRSRGRQGWYARWVDRSLGAGAALGPDAASVYPLVLPRLTEVGLLARLEGKRGESIWGVAPGALRVSSRLVRLTCSGCQHRVNAGADEAPLWEGGPCLTARCDGRYGAEGPVELNYFGRLLSCGALQRIFSAEHTGLLSRQEREAVEREFKWDPAVTGVARKPWFANLLSCTPTLEMGIDIGDLSSAILCSVPPGQANYLQRIGRAGRRDGNSLLLTVANARPHDMYFFESPGEMMEGEVEPPGVYLDAAAVLERQLTAFCLDRWVAAEGDAAELPDKLSGAFEGVKSKRPDRFPQNLMAFVHKEKPAIMREFLEMFGRQISGEAQEHLRRYLLGGEEDAGLDWRITSALHGELRQRDSLSYKADRLAKEIRELKKSKAPPLDLDEQLREREAEKEAMQALVAQIDRRQVLEFLTDEGLLPNYAFPESAVRLTSVIWRRKRKAGGSGSKYDTWTHEYARSPGSALSELAPQATFYAGARRVRIDQVDVAVSEVENWRLCSDCNHAERAGTGEDSTACPACGSASWPDPGQRHRLLRLRQVFAGAADRQSRIRDDADDREPRFFQRQMMVDIRDEDRVAAWSIPSPRLPFGFEYLRGATFREVNFGELAGQDAGQTTRIAGREQVRPGFRICGRCGKVQQPGKDPVHALSCPSRKQGAKPQYEDCLYLYREFSSEAVRMLLPVVDMGSTRQLNSFVAALQLGLRETFGGRVDHLHTTVYSDPVPDSAMRKQFLVLFDAVPGGTGYIKQLVTPARAGGPLKLFEVLASALKRLESCACWTDAERDGCYRCLLGYRNAQDMDDTSASVAADLLRQLLAEQDRLESIDSLGDVSISGLLDSVLEARFLEALRQARWQGKPARLRPSMVNGKPGYLFELADRAWTLEPQVEVGQADGLGMTVSIDFLMLPAWVEKDHAPRTPIAVFLDGWEFHRDRVGKDMLQRMLLLASGRWDVWSLTWYDLDEVLLPEPTRTAANLLHPRLDELESHLGNVEGFFHLRDIGTRRHFDLLIEDLVGPDAIPWRALAARILFSRMGPPQPGDEQRWDKLISELAPPAVRPLLSWQPTRHVLIDEGQTNPWATLVALHGPGGLQLLASLRDEPGARDEPELLRAWNGFLRLLQHLRHVGPIWFVTRHGQGELDYQPLLRLREAPVQQESWCDPEEIEPEFLQLCRQLFDAGVEEPDLDMGVPNQLGGVWIDAHLVWDEQRVAVITAAALTDKVGQMEQGWRVFVLEELDEPAPLVDALGDKGAC